MVRFILTALLLLSTCSYVWAQNDLMNPTWGISEKEFLKSTEGNWKCSDFEDKRGCTNMDITLDGVKVDFFTYVFINDSLVSIQLYIKFGSDSIWKQAESILTKHYGKVSAPKPNSYINDTKTSYIKAEFGNDKSIQIMVFDKNYEIINTPKSSTPAYTIHGYAGIAWGSSLEDAQKIIKSKGSVLECTDLSLEPEDEALFCVSKNCTGMFGRTQMDVIFYIFQHNFFTAVSAIKSDATRTDYDSLVQLLALTYGKSDDEDKNAYFKMLNETVVIAGIEDNSIEMLIFDRESDFFPFFVRLQTVGNK